jgi:two-component system chemotaxis sensor kinase CheA
MRGEIRTETAKGKGAKFTITLPVRMATIKVMVFRLGAELYCLPLASIVETFNVSEHEILKVHHREMVVFRNENLPLVRLRSVLGVGANGIKRHAAIVATIGEEKRALLVDNIVSQEEMIVKSLDELVRNRLFSGVSIYSDGRPSLILEARGLE